MAREDVRNTQAPGLPLKGIRVLDFSWLLPGPFCSMQLADLGAEVIKVESPGGDYARDMLPGLFSVANRNKAGLSLDLKSPDAAGLVERLVGQVDVVLEGFRPGVADRLGIGYERLSQINPGLVYASLSGYGSHGPDANRTGHDLNYLAMSGALSIPSQLDAPPSRGGLPIADLSAGLFAALGIVSSLLERTASGKGRYLDVAMVASLMNLAQVRTADHLASGGTDWPHVNPLNDMFRTKDGHWITLALVEPKFFREFCDLAGCADLAGSQDYRDHLEKRDPTAAQRLAGALRDIVAGRTRDEWSALLEEHALPYAPVLSPAEAETSPQIESLGLGRLDLPGGAPLPGSFGFPIPGLGTREGVPAPEKGEHSDQVLASFGFAPDQIESLRSRGVLG